MIFKAEELDEDDEIPAPFDHQQNRDNFNIKNNEAPV